MSDYYQNQPSIFELDGNVYCKSSKIAYETYEMLSNTCELIRVEKNEQIEYKPSYSYLIKLKRGGKIFKLESNELGYSKLRILFLQRGNEFYNPKNKTDHYLFIEKYLLKDLKEKGNIL